MNMNVLGSSGLFAELTDACCNIACRLHNHARVIGQFQHSQWRESNNNFFSNGMTSNRTWCHRLNTCEMKKASRM